MLIIFNINCNQTAVHRLGVLKITRTSKFVSIKAVMLNVFMA